MQSDFGYIKHAVWGSTQSSVLKLDSLPNDKFWAWTKYKAFANDELNVAKLMIFVFSTAESM